MEHLYQKLTEYGESDFYPLHMPGHKRREWGDLPEIYYKRDITEIDGFDNLHQPEEILRELQGQAQKLYGAEESYYLVNGSTCGILSAISAALPGGGHLLMTRNCHKAVYHAAYLRGLKTSYLYPEQVSGYDICEAISVKAVSEALRKHTDIGAIVVVSPTYEGRIADIAGIAAEAHRHKIPLIVDEAHGAHLGLSPLVQENSCRLGADIVIHSTHKTLPALTQTALLHVNGTLVDREQLRRFLRIYQTSSPSYLLMASIDNALTRIERQGGEIYRQFVERYRSLTNALMSCRYLRVIPEADERQDKGKLLVSVRNTNLTGKKLYDILRERYHLQPEMAGESFVLLMFTINDSEEGYQRAKTALLQIDSELEKSKAESESNIVLPAVRGICTIAEAWDAEGVEIPLTDADGRVAAEFVNCYPPGIPILVPGEIISADIICKIEAWMNRGLTVQGIRMKEREPYIRVMDGRREAEILAVASR